MGPVAPGLGADARQRGRTNWRPRRPRTRRGTALLTGALLALALIAPVAAAEFLNGGSPDVAQGETFEEDLYVAGGNVDVAGTITMDLLVLSGDLTITTTGRVNGNVNALSGTAEIEGDVGRSLRVAAGEVTVSGAVGGNVVVAGGDVTLDRGATVLGDVVVAGGTIEVLGQVAGDVRGSAGKVVINGPVGGNVDVNTGDLELDSSARIGGRLEYTSTDDAEIHPAAAVAGGIDRDAPERFGVQDGLVGWLNHPITRVLWQLVAGAALILLLPRGAVAAANGVRHRPLPSFGLGLLLLIATPVAAVILFATVVGWAILLIGLAAFAIALYLSQLVVGLAIGRFILPNRWGDEGRGYNLLAMTIGVLLIAALRLIPLPFVSPAVALVVGVLGLGAIVLGPRLRPPAPSPSSAYGYPSY